MKKYRIGISYEFRNIFEIEANSLEEAQDIAIEEMSDFELSEEGLECRSDYEFFDCKLIKEENPQQRIRNQVIATGNMHSIENWNATHNENLKI